MKIAFSTINRRHSNEDCCLAFNMETWGNKNHKFSVLLLADGLGGHSHGEIFSRLAVRTMASKISEAIVGSAIISGETAEPTSFGIDSMHHILSATNETVKTTMNENDWLEGGTTIAALVTTDDSFVYTNLGDSLIFHWIASEGKLRQLSDDHSISGMLLKNGYITSEEALVHPYRNRIRYFIGIPLLPSLEELENTKRGTMERGDILFLCSDGISGCLSLKEIEEIFNRLSHEVDALIIELIIASRLKGQTDNQSIIIYKHDKSDSDGKYHGSLKLDENAIRRMVMERRAK